MIIKNSRTNYILAFIGSAVFLALAYVSLGPVSEKIMIQDNILIINLRVILDLAVTVVFLLGSVALGISAHFLLPDKNK